MSHVREINWFIEVSHHNKCIIFCRCILFFFLSQNAVKNYQIWEPLIWTHSIALAKPNILLQKLRMHLLTSVPNQRTRWLLSLCVTFSLNFSSCVWVLLGPLKIYISWSCLSVFEEFGSVAIVFFYKRFLFSVTLVSHLRTVYIFKPASLCVYSASARSEWKNLLVKLHDADPQKCFPRRVTQHAADLAQSCYVSVFARSVKWGRVPVSLPVYTMILGALLTDGSPTCTPLKTSRRAAFLGQAGGKTGPFSQTDVLEILFSIRRSNTMPTPSHHHHPSPLQA